MVCFETIVTFFYCFTDLKIDHSNKEYIFLYIFHKDVKQNVITTHLNYHTYWGNYTWLSIYISKIQNIENCEKMYCSFYILVYFFMKNVRVYLYLKTFKKNILKICPICSTSEC